MVQALVYRAVRRPSTDVWHTRRVCASLPFVIVDILDAFKDQLQPAMDAAGSDPVDRFVAGYRRYCEIVDQNLVVGGVVADVERGA